MSLLVEIQKVLETYSLEEICESNETTIEDVLYLLVDEGHLKLPDPLPVDVYE